MSIRTPPLIRTATVAVASRLDSANAIQFECRATDFQLWLLPGEALGPRP